ncbi:MAG: SUF system NifU family Fe-S cluster assembly protein [Burkholderiales bacterium]|nr:SUF system NifU family Fe-S cluster assembly protein [Burkholderiales bacterium]
MDSKQLYQEVILDHNRKPRNWGRLERASHHAEGLNPLCGDHIWVSLELDGDRVSNVAFEGQSCAICKASASMMTANIKGKSVGEVEQLIREFRDMATGKLDVARQSNHLGRLSVFAGVKDLPSRVKCAILPWHTLHAAFAQQESASTEGDQDPFAASTARGRSA